MLTVNCNFQEDHLTAKPLDLSKFWKTFCFYLFVCLFVCLLKEILWSQTWSVSTPDSNTMGVTSSHCHPQFSGRPSCYKTTRSLKTLENFMFVYLFVCLFVCLIFEGDYAKSNVEFINSWCQHNGGNKCSLSTAIFRKIISLWNLSTPDCMSACCQLQFSGRPSCRKTTRSFKLFHHFYQPSEKNNSLNSHHHQHEKPGIFQLGLAFN